MDMRRAAVVLALALPLAAQVKKYEPGFNLFSPQQDIEIGREAAEEVRRSMPVVNNAELTGYVTRVGERLAKSSRAGKFPYSFAVVNDPNINAFALPGGPVFVHSGLLAAVDNESELAGVLAHEISHAALRHGTSQVSKANLIQLPVLLAAGFLGDRGGIWPALAQLGIDLGATSLLLRYSRDAEKEADLNGAQIMNEVGYDPAFAASFFQKLEKEKGASPGRLEQLFSSHPNPGNRVQYVAEQNRYLPRREYSELDPAGLARAKQIVASLPAAPKPGGAGKSGTPDPRVIRPSGRYVNYQGRGYAVRLPDNWQVFGDHNAGTVTVAPRAAVVSGRRGETLIGYGLMISHYYPQNRRVNLNRDTAALTRELLAGNSGMRQTGNPRSVRVAGQAALVTPLESPSPFAGQREIDMLVTVAQPGALFYMVFISPESEWPETQPAFDEVVRSLRFGN
jgi:Zn-dependent protease with chaperone function